MVKLHTSVIKKIMMFRRDRELVWNSSTAEFQAPLFCQIWTHVPLTSFPFFLYQSR